MQLFYHPEIMPGDKQVVFEKTESHHMVKVLRYDIGQKISITNGMGTIFEAELTHTSPKKCLAVISASQTQPLPKCQVHVAIAPTKHMDRFEWFVEKATELGVASITPILSRHSERKMIKIERLEKRVDAATKQSLSAYRPKINPLTTFTDFLKQSPVSACQYIAHCHQPGLPHLMALAPRESSYTVLIGPEGDFSLNEVEQAISQGYEAASLGDHRLRTETAGIAAIHSLNLRQIS